MRCISMFSGRMSPKIRSMFSSRPIWIRRRSSSVPSPWPWKWSLIRRANSASLVPRILLRRPTPRISCSPVAGVLALGHQRHLAVVVDEADPGQPLVGDAGAELHGVEVAQRDAAFGEGAVELDQQRLVLGADRPDAGAWCRPWRSRD